MELTEVKRAIENPVNREKIWKANLHQARVRFHTRTALSRMEAGRYVNTFLNSIEPLLTREAFHTFLHLFKFPLNTIELTEKIKVDYSKVFDGRNPIYNVTLNNPDHEDDWMEYREKYGFDWRNDGLTAMMECFNDIVVIDMPAEQTTERPEPYMYIVDISNVIDYQEQDNDLAWVYFEYEKEKRLFLCDEYYRVFDAEDNLIEEKRHEIDKCPARFFWTDKLENGVRKSILTNELTNLDRYLAYDTLNENLNTYARYPLYWGIEAQCDYSNEKGNCRKGFLHDEHGDYLISRDGGVEPCPVCKQRKIGAGSFVEVPETNAAGEPVDPKPPVGIVKIDVDSLKYNNEDLAARKEGIIARVTGKNWKVINDHAINEDQVAAVHEGELTAINRVKDNFESIMEWVDATMLQIRYGDSFQDISISLGTEFYLFTYTEADQLYHKAIENSVNTVILDQLEDEMYATKYKNNPNMYTRIELIKHLTPFRHITRKDATLLQKQGIINILDYYLICNMSSLLMRFERENAPIEVFGENLEIDKRIDIIKNYLYGYAKENIERRNETEGITAPSDGGSPGVRTQADA